MKQFRSQYKKEVELVENEDPSLDSEPKLTIKDQPKDVFSLFKIVHNLINGKLKQIKALIDERADGILVEDYSLHALKFILENQQFHAPSLLHGF